MKIFDLFAKTALLMTSLVFFFSGCMADRDLIENVERVESSDASFDNRFVDTVDIVGLSEISLIDEARSISHLKAFVDLKDRWGEKIHENVILRFELYEYVPRSSERKGTRIFQWEDIDTSGNGRVFWNEVFDSYQIDLSLNKALNKEQRYVLFLTVFTSEGKRLEDQEVIHYGNS